ncbi:MAG: response regulator [Patescibacteria group bacterium]|nr:response regulator [Patescibacteria group bacterium]
MKEIIFLVVDDYDGVRAVLHVAIEDYCKDRGIGCEVLVASNGREAFPILNEKYIDVLLTDVKMPFMGGEELVQLLDIISHPTVPIMMTGIEGYKPPEEIRFAVEGLLKKPISEEYLYWVLDRIIEDIHKKETKENEKNKE